MVASEFARRGFTVALPTGIARDIDILAYRNGKNIAVQVKSISKGALQVNLGKFLNVDFDEETEKQIVRGPRSDLDNDICFVIVFLGERLGEDRFYYATLEAFVEVLRSHHVGYLEKHDGKRPGQNKTSKHAALTRTQIEDSGEFCCLDEFLERLDSE